MTDLTQRLRAVDVNSDSECYMSAPLFSEAADALDAKDAEIERYRLALLLIKRMPRRGEMMHQIIFDRMAIAEKALNGDAIDATDPGDDSARSAQMLAKMGNELARYRAAIQRALDEAVADDMDEWFAGLRAALAGKE